jgi:hypothetical protein
MTSLPARRAQLLTELAALDTMEYGSLRAEHRPKVGGGSAGPYYQHQVWADGKNLSERIPAAAAPALAQAVANRQRAETLVAEYIALTVQQTRGRTEAEEVSKKNARSWRRPSRRKSPLS